MQQFRILMELLKRLADDHILGVYALAQTVFQVNFEADLLRPRYTLVITEIRRCHSHAHLDKNTSPLLPDFVRLRQHDNNEELKSGAA